MRRSLILTVCAMGIVAIVLVIATGETYRRLALDSQRAGFADLVKIKVDDMLDEVKLQASNLGLSVQSDLGFREALASGDPVRIERQLNQHFHRYFVTANILSLSQLVVFDTQFNRSAESSEGVTLSRGRHGCAALIEQARLRRGADRMKQLSMLCTADRKPYVVSLVPIGGLLLKGYLQVVVDPAPNLIPLEQQLDMPLMIKSANGDVLYASYRWPDTRMMNSTLLVTHDYPADGSGETAYRLSLAYNVQPLFETLVNTRRAILITTGLATLLTALLALVVLQKTALTPLSKLAGQLRLVREDKANLGKAVAVIGNTEVASLATDFNEMSHELHALYEKLEHMAFTDSLTSLPNRSLFYDRLQQLTLLGRRRSASFALIMMDLDRFKNINDTLGHHVGDQLLQQVSARLNNVVRSCDTIARLGGDEFAVLLPQVETVEGAEIVAKRFVEAMNTPVEVSGHSLIADVSIGIAMYPRDGLDGNALVQKADVAMYHAKQDRSTYAFYQTEYDTHTVSQLTLEAELRLAIENKTLELYYQPKVDLSRGTVVGVEALLRWQHSERGFIAPDTFIPLAEHMGLIHELTQWVLSVALQQCAHWHRRGWPLTVAVNLSARSLRDALLAELVHKVLTMSAVPPQYLTLELTESGVMADPKLALTILGELDAMGVGLAVDDFGTGYSSLAYLKKLPVDEIKIDRSFVMDMLDDRNNEVIVHSTVDLAHNMGLRVTAEGIETEQVWDELVKLGCDYGQGYYMCRPVPAAAVEQWFRESPRGLQPTSMPLLGRG